MRLKIVNAGRELELDYLDEGQGPAVLLIHGFASRKEVNWVDTGWTKALLAAGFRVIAFDNRGHGASTKFHDKGSYRLDDMAQDAVLLLDALGVERCHVVGYSMGARIAAMIAIARPERVDRLVLSGNGWGMVEGSGDWTPVRDALLAPALADVTHPRGRAFRIFADHTRSDREALAACVEGVRQLVPLEGVRSIANETLVAIGTQDEVAGSGEKLVENLQAGRFLPIPGRDHMRAVGDRVHVNGVVGFLLNGLGQ